MLTDVFLGMRGLGPRGLILCAVALAGCSSSSSRDSNADAGAGALDDEENQKLSEALFAIDHLIEVEIELPPDDWAALRVEGRSLTDVFSGCAPEDFEYAYFGAKVTVDGVSYDDVAVRKKGYLGSLSTLRPSIKVNFGRTEFGNPDETRKHSGMKRMTLNNDKQDPSHTHQCMAYGLFERAGSIASRCNFAHVVVNGEDLGIYTHVESVKKPMLRRHFEDDEGNLYEGQGGDFVAGRTELLELKTNKLVADRSDIERVVDALLVDDDELLEALGAVVDMDAFLTFWSMEVLTGHWDSYTGGSNNFLTYHDPTSDRFFFMPWGTDGAFSQERIFTPGNDAVTVLAQGRIANRLYGHSEGRAMYFERLEALFDQVWDEQELLAEVDMIGEFTDASPVALEAQRDAIKTQTAAVRAELGQASPDWIDRGNDDGERRCNPEVLTPVSGTFATTWQSMQPTAAVTVELQLDGTPWEPDMLLVNAGTEEGSPGVANIRLISPEGNSQVSLLLLQIPVPYLTVGEHPMHGFETNGLFVTVNQMTGDFRLIGFVGGGSITLDMAGTNPGDPIEGSFEGSFIQIAPR